MQKVVPKTPRSTVIMQTFQVLPSKGMDFAMYASHAIRNGHFRKRRSAPMSYGAPRPISVRNFILLALAIVLAAGVTMLVISQASASEIAGGFVPAGMGDGAIGVAALGSLLMSSFVAGFLVLSRHTQRNDDDSRSKN